MFVDPFARGAPTRVCFITVYRLLALYINYRSSLIRTSLPSHGNGFPSSLKYDRADRCRIECGLAWMRVGQTPVITSIEIERRVSVKMPLAIGNTCLPPQRTVTRVLARQTRDSTPRIIRSPPVTKFSSFPATLSTPSGRSAAVLLLGKRDPLGTEDSPAVSKARATNRVSRRDLGVATYF